jgi:glutamine amidotransferase
MEKHIPVLGICVGMQIMAARSDEGKLNGLGWIDAEVKKIDTSLSEKIYLPHMGWNDVTPFPGNGLFNTIENDARFYFLHSYYFLPKNEKNVIATTDYHGSFASGVQNNNVFGVQFHPEKSHQWGIQLLKNFAELS